MHINSDWYESAFDEDYLERYAHRDEEEARAGCELVLRTLGDAKPCRALDLCCGAGRHVLAFREAGVEIMGGDLSLPLLRVVHQRLAEKGLSAPLIRLDMRKLPFSDSSFDLVTNFFTAFGYFEGDAENFAVFREVHRVLRPGGAFVLDFLNAAAVRDQMEKAPGFQVQTAEDGTRWEVRRALSHDGRRVNKVMRPIDRPDRVVQESLRLFSSEELTFALRAAGISDLVCFGDYSGAPFESSESPRFLAIGRRK